MTCEATRLSGFCARAESFAPKKAHQPSAQDRAFSLAPIQPISPQKSPRSRAEGANCVSAVDVVDYRGKGGKTLPLLHIPSSKQGPSQLIQESPPSELIVARDSPDVPRNSLQRAALLRFHRSAESTVGAFAITQIVGKSGEKLASAKLLFVDDLLSIRSRTPRGNGEFLAKMQRL